MLSCKPGRPKDAAGNARLEHEHAFDAPTPPNCRRQMHLIAGTHHLGRLPPHRQLEHAQVFGGAQPDRLCNRSVRDVASQGGKGAALGQNDGNVIHTRVRQFTQAPTTPINLTARDVRQHLGCE
jgi:hypothetical protein